MKRLAGGRPSNATVVENYEHMLMCLICRSLFDDHDHQPKFLPCHHTFCKDCLREYVRQMGDDIECPSCRKIAAIPAAGVAALQTNFYAKYIQNLVYGGGAAGGDRDAKICERHAGHMLKYYCNECSVSICDVCVEESGCKLHQRSPVAAVAERMRQNIDASFTTASTVISQKKAELESRLRALSDEKDRALLCIDSAFEAHVHTLGRRATLLKNKVIDIYNENSNGLESGLEDVDTAMTCVVSLREYHESAVDNGDFDAVLIGRGTAEIDEVAYNISDRVRPPEIHIVFDGDHGIDKFRTCSKDLGRVVCNRSAPKPPPDITPTDDPSPMAAVAPETNIPGRNHLPRDSMPVDADQFDGGDGGLYIQFENVRLSHNAASDAEHYALSQMYITDSGATEDLIAGGMSSLQGSGDSSAAGNKSPNKMAGRPTCITGITNNNYFSPQLQLGMTKFAPATTNIDSHSRTSISYDEQRLQQELGESSGDGVDPTFCMSRSEYWPLPGSHGEAVMNDNGEHGNVIVELSGEQTTL